MIRLVTKGGHWVDPARNEGLSRHKSRVFAVVIAAEYGIINSEGMCPTNRTVDRMTMSNSFPSGISL